MTKTYVLFFMLLTAAFISSCDLLGDGNGNGNLLGAETLDCAIVDDIVLTNQNENGVDYIVDCVLDLRGRMTVEEGTVIEFSEGAGIEVSQGGSIRAEGIGGSPVIFRGQDDEPSWLGIYILTEQTTSVFDFVEIEDAGEGTPFGILTEENAALTVDGRIRFSNSTIRNSGGHGIWTSAELYATEISVFEDNVITGCTDYPLYIKADYLKEMDVASSRYEENGKNMIAFTENSGGRMEDDVTLEDADIPYLFNSDVEVVKKLEVEAGVDIRMAEGTEFSVTFSDATITMAGTATNRISLGGEESEAGYWAGLLIRNENSHIFENVDISDGASTSVGLGDGKANVTLEFGCELTMIDCTSSRSSSGCDVLVGPTSTLIDTNSNMTVCE